jgi:hypothetical protein
MRCRFDRARTKASENSIWHGLKQVRTLLHSIGHHPRQVCTHLLVMGRFLRISLSVLLIVILSLPTRISCDDRKLINIGAFFPDSGPKVGSASRSCRPAAEMAFDHINRRSDVLAGYRLNMTWRIDQVSDRVFTQPGQTWKVLEFKTSPGKSWNSPGIIY